MPVHHFVDEGHLVDRRLTNYWGYNSLGFFAPEVRYATGGDGRQVAEFRTMVKRLHRAGIEVILDVVYNHTAEGNHLGPMLSFKGVDNSSYYRLVPDDERHYMSYFACPWPAWFCSEAHAECSCETLPSMRSASSASGLAAVA